MEQALVLLELTPTHREITQLRVGKHPMRKVSERQHMETILTPKVHQHMLLGNIRMQKDRKHIHTVCIHMLKDFNQMHMVIFLMQKVQAQMPEVRGHILRDTA